MNQASILVVDPDVDSRLKICSILLAEDYDVGVANDWPAALAQAAVKPLDLLITDVALESGNGFDLLSLIRERPELADLPAMFMSAHQSSGVIRRSYEFGAAFQLKKPVERAVLVELTDKALWMPHLVNTHLEQQTVRAPHVSFAKNPIAPMVEDLGFTSNSIFSGTPISF